MNSNDDKHARKLNEAAAKYWQQAYAGYGGTATLRDVLVAQSKHVGQLLFDKAHELLMLASDQSAERNDKLRAEAKEYALLAKEYV